MIYALSFQEIPLAESQKAKPICRSESVGTASAPTKEF